MQPASYANLPVTQPAPSGSTVCLVLLVTVCVGCAITGSTASLSTITLDSSAGFSYTLDCHDSTIDLADRGLGSCDILVLVAWLSGRRKSLGSLTNVDIQGNLLGADGADPLIDVIEEVRITSVTSFRSQRTGIKALSASFLSTWTKLNRKLAGQLLMQEAAGVSDIVFAGQHNHPIIDAFILMNAKKIPRGESSAIFIEYLTGKVVDAGDYTTTLAVRENNARFGSRFGSRFDARFDVLLFNQHVAAQYGRRELVERLAKHKNT